MGRVQNILIWNGFRVNQYRFHVNLQLCIKGVHEIGLAILVYQIDGDRLTDGFPVLNLCCLSVHVQLFWLLRLRVLVHQFWRRHHMVSHTHLLVLQTILLDPLKVTREPILSIQVVKLTAIMRMILLIIYLLLLILMATITVLVRVQVLLPAEVRLAEADIADVEIATVFEEGVAGHVVFYDGVGADNLSVVIRI